MNFDYFRQNIFISGKLLTNANSDQYKNTVWMDVIERPVLVMKSCCNRCGAALIGHPCEMTHLRLAWYPTATILYQQVVTTTEVSRVNL